MSDSKVLPPLDLARSCATCIHSKFQLPTTWGGISKKQTGNCFLGCKDATVRVMPDINRVDYDIRELFTSIFANDSVEGGWIPSVPREEFLRRLEIHARREYGTVAHPNAVNIITRGTKMFDEMTAAHEWLNTDGKNVRLVHTTNVCEGYEINKLGGNNSRALLRMKEDRKRVTRAEKQAKEGVAVTPIAVADLVTEVASPEALALADADNADS